MQTALPTSPPLAPEPAPINIGTTIRAFRLQKGMSQGDIEKRTGLLRCYLSRVENGHTVPSLETLQKIAGALDLPLSQFFSEEEVVRHVPSLSLNEDEIRFLTQIQRYSANLGEFRDCRSRTAFRSPYGEQTKVSRGDALSCRSSSTFSNDCIALKVDRAAEGCRRA